jgi:hypothetical protein
VACDPKRALELLRIGSGRADATFRDGQEDAIRHIVEGKGRLLVVQKTVHRTAVVVLPVADDQPLGQAIQPRRMISRSDRPFSLAGSKARRFTW